jgi:hypothetical protein
VTKVATLLLRISVALALIGMFMDIAMGVRQDFALAPAHAHLNLLGFLMLFMAGLYYRIVPQAAEGLPGRLYAALAVIGAIAFPMGSPPSCWAAGSPRGIRDWGCAYNARQHGVVRNRRYPHRRGDAVRRDQIER